MITSNTKETEIEKENVLVLLDLKSSSNRSVIGFFPSDHQEIVVPLPTAQPFQSLSFSFRTRSNVSTLIQLDRFSLNVDVDGYLALVHLDHRAERFLLDDHEQKAINDGHLYHVYLERTTDRTIHAWLMKKKTSNRSVTSTKKITVTWTKFDPIQTIILGARNQFRGCLKDLIFNDQPLEVKNLSPHRQQCPSSNVRLKSTEFDRYEKIYIDQLISFKESDRPLIIRFDRPENFASFSFVIYTQEANSMFASLTTDDVFLLITLHNRYLMLTFDHFVSQRTMKIYLNETNPLNDGREHRIALKFLHPDELQLEIDGKVLVKKGWKSFLVQTIYLGQIDGLIREKFNEFDGDSFIGCVKDVTWNEKPLVQFEHLHHLDRLQNVCPLAKRGRK